MSDPVTLPGLGEDGEGAAQDIVFEGLIGPNISGLTGPNGGGSGRAHLSGGPSSGKINN